MRHSVGARSLERARRCDGDASGRLLRLAAGSRRGFGHLSATLVSLAKEPFKFGIDHAIQNRLFGSARIVGELTCR
ncbi:MAG: hypothetical protein ACI91F_001349 [Candidatus Binatia bacterium]|jgi:hypothetical protein